MFDFFKTSSEYTIEKFMKHVVLWIVVGLIVTKLSSFLWNTYKYELRNLSNPIVQIFEILLLTILIVTLFILHKKSYFTPTLSIFFLLLLIFPLIGLPGFLTVLFPELTAFIPKITLNYHPTQIILLAFQISLALLSYKAFDSTKHVMQKLGIIIYYISIVLFIALAAIYIFTLFIPKEDIIEKDMPVLYSFFLESICNIYFLFMTGLIFCDIQKIKQLGLDVINKDNNTIRSTILLSAFILILDFGYSPLRIFIPWGWKKE